MWLQMLQMDPNLITPSRIYDLMLVYRDLKSWPDIIRLAEVHLPLSLL